jgi:hypothetical protein
MILVKPGADPWIGTKSTTLPPTGDMGKTLVIRNRKELEK